MNITFVLGDESNVSTMQYAILHDSIKLDYDNSIFRFFSLKLTPFIDFVLQLRHHRLMLTRNYGILCVWMYQRFSGGINFTFFLRLKDV